MPTAVRLLRLAQRFAVLAFLIAAAIIAATTPSAPTAIYAIAQGIGISWIGSGTWARKYRWAARTQTTVIGAAIITLIGSNPAAGGAGLLVYAIAMTLLHLAHVVAQFIAVLNLAAPSITAEAARRTILWATFGVPLLLASSPSLPGAIAAIVCCVTAFFAFARNGRNRALAA